MENVSKSSNPKQIVFGSHSISSDVPYRFWTSIQNFTPFSLEPSCSTHFPQHGVAGRVKMVKVVVEPWRAGSPGAGVHELPPSLDHGQF